MSVIVWEGMAETDLFFNGDDIMAAVFADDHHTAEADFLLTRATILVTGSVQVLLAALFRSHNWGLTAGNTVFR